LKSIARNWVPNHSAVCYLCGLPIADEKSDDHVVPAALIKRKQPKVRGFVYAGRLPTHPHCNNRFGPETYVSSALELLATWADPDTFMEREMIGNPEIRVLMINSDKLPSFTSKDLKFFKISDVREKAEGEWSAAEFFGDKQRTNPQRDALNVALSVLAKSATALLISRKGLPIPSSWQIYACPFTGTMTGLGLVSGETVALDQGVRADITQTDEGDWFVAFEAHGVVVFMLFSFSGKTPEAKVRAGIKNADCYVFQGGSINELLTQGWVKV
jgi:hypothetical protein